MYYLASEHLAKRHTWQIDVSSVFTGINVAVSTPALNSVIRQFRHLFDHT
jgi:hypothetical protein